MIPGLYLYARYQVADGDGVGMKEAGSIRKGRMAGGTGRLGIRTLVEKGFSLSKEGFSYLYGKSSTYECIHLGK